MNEPKWMAELEALMEATKGGVQIVYTWSRLPPELVFHGEGCIAVHPDMLNSLPRRTEMLHSLPRRKIEEVRSSRLVGIPIVAVDGNEEARLDLIERLGVRTWLEKLPPSEYYG